MESRERKMNECMICLVCKRMNDTKRQNIPHMNNFVGSILEIIHVRVLTTLSLLPPIAE